MAKFISKVTTEGDVVFFNPEHIIFMNLETNEYEYPMPADDALDAHPYTLVVAVHPADTLVTFDFAFWDYEDALDFASSLVDVTPYDDGAVDVVYLTDIDDIFTVGEHDNDDD